MTEHGRYGQIRLTRAEQRLLLERFTLPTELREQLHPDREVVEVLIAEADAEELRDQAGDLFQEIGVDPSNSPTAEGRTLDGLIDKFFTG
jgi:hypothetical protein